MLHSLSNLWNQLCLIFVHLHGPTYKYFVHTQIHYVAGINVLLFVINAVLAGGVAFLFGYGLMIIFSFIGKYLYMLFLW